METITIDLTKNELMQVIAGLTMLIQNTKPGEYCDMLAVLRDRLILEGVVNG